MTCLPRAPAHVLLVEDNPGDVGLVREGLSSGGFPHVLHVTTSGQQALEFLRRQNGHHRAPRPEIVILDLNLPGRPGNAVLADIKEDPDLRAIPVCILTSSADPADIAAAYAARANAYVTKPHELDAYLDAIRDLQRFWLATASLPNGYTSWR